MKYDVDLIKKMSLEFFKSEKGRNMLCHGGHLFYKDKGRDETTHWKCSNFVKTKCKARVTTKNAEVVKTLNEHNHCADAASIEAAVHKDRLRFFAKNSNLTPHSIISEVAATCSDVAAPKLPSVDSMKRTVRNLRFKDKGYPGLPANISDFSIIDPYNKTFKGDLFLQYDSGRSQNRILIFATQRNIDLLSTSEHWYADGTFKTVPLLFNQLYTVHGFKDKISIPLVFALLPNKNEDTYVHFLENLKNLGSMSPKTITTDFEIGMIKAFHKVFPNALQKGCFFHFSQCIWRVIQKNGLKNVYEKDAIFSHKMKMLAAIAFVPCEKVAEAFSSLCDSNEIPAEAQKVLDYFEDTWIGRLIRNNKRREPKFRHDMWNIYSRIKDGLPRTTNAVEGWHRGFEEQVAAHHPNLWRFVECLKKEQAVNELQIEKFLSGEGPSKQRKLYRDLDERLRNLVLSFSNNTKLVEYLKCIAHSINY